MPTLLRVHSKVFNMAKRPTTNEFRSLTAQLRRMTTPLPIPPEHVAGQRDGWHIVRVGRAPERDNAHFELRYGQRKIAGPYSSEKAALAALLAHT